MANEQAVIDDNWVKGMIAKDDSTGESRSLEVATATGRLKVDATGTVTGQQYTEGDTSTTITGNAMLGEAPSDTLEPVQLDASGSLKVSIEADNAGIGGGIQYPDGDIQATPTGTVAMGTDGSGVYAVATDTDGHQQVDVLSSALPSGAATEANQTTIIGHIDGIEGLLTTIDADTGAILADTANIDTNIATVAGAVDGTEVQVDVVTMPTVNVESDGTALSSNQVSVTNSATTIVSASAGRKGVIVVNQGSVACYVGAATVTTSNGILLNPGESIGIPTDSEVQGVTASSSTTIGYLAFA